VAIDGAFFHGDASKASILTKKRLEQRMAALDRNIAIQCRAGGQRQGGGAVAAAGAPATPHR